MTKEAFLISPEEIKIHNTTSVKISKKGSILFSHKDIGDIDRGGLCVLFKTLSSGLSKLGWDVHVITTRPFTMKEANVHILESKENPSEYSKEVTTVIKQVIPNIAESSNWRFELLDYSKSPNRQTKIVVRADPSAGTLFSGAKNLEKGEKKLCQNADLILAISEFARKDIQNKYGILDSNIHVVYNGIAEQKFPSNYKYFNSGELLSSPYGEGKPLKRIAFSKIIKPAMLNIIWIGKATKMKGFHLLEKIVESAPKNFNFILNIGYSPIEVNWGKSNYNRCFFVRDLTKEDQQLLLEKADIFLSTSTVEGFGIAVVEALRAGLPVILNEGCEAYHEFSSYEEVILTDMKKTKNIIDVLLKNKGKKVNYSRLPSDFTEKELIRKSVKHYEILLKK